jgi:archaeosortase B (VPXXXP-CTERM-specific)
MAIKIDGSNSDLLKVASLFILLVLFFSVLYIIFSDQISFINSSTASALALLLNMLGVDAMTNGSIVRLDGLWMVIVDECTGIYEILVYTAAVLAFPTSMKKKAVGIAFGIPLLTLLNMTRLICLAFVGIYAAESFEFVHLYLWQVTLILLIVIVLSIWIYKVVKVEW